MTPPGTAATAAPLEIDPAAPPVADVLCLTRRLARGEESAFQEFYARYFDRLFRYLLTLTRGQEDPAREALQETFLRVARYVRPFDDQIVFWCWLTALGRSAVRDGGRKRRRYQVLLHSYALRFLCLLTGPSVEESHAPMAQLLGGCLKELEPEDRALVEGKYYARTSVRDLACRTGLSEKAVESRLSRLRHHLRERLLEKLREEESC